MKQLAKELDVPVIGLSQLSRQVEQREDKRPQLSDLRESGSIEQDADIVLFIYREDYYLAAKQPCRRPSANIDKWREEMARVYGTAEVIVAKQRHGSTGKVRLKFDSRITKFSDAGRRKLSAGDARLTEHPRDGGRGRRSRPGALSVIYGPLRTDVVAAFGLLDLLRRSRRKIQRLGDILVPAINVRPELDARAIPERGLIEQPYRDFVAAA